MKTSKKWIEHFTANLTQYRIDWDIQPNITAAEIETILHSTQAWQLGETSEGADLIRASTIYSGKINDPDYLDAVKLFIKEEQKHGNNLGKYLDAIHKPRIETDWGDSLFRKIRHLNTSMEMWTLTVITVESAAQVFYQSLKDATGCRLLKQVCTDILIDEAFHIDFQTERMAMIFEKKSPVSKFICRYLYPVFFFSTLLVVWFAHKQIFKAGGVDFKKYIKKMRYKYFKTLYKISFTNAYGFALPGTA